MRHYPQRRKNMVYSILDRLRRPFFRVSVTLFSGHQHPAAMLTGDWVSTLLPRRGGMSPCACTIAMSSYAVPPQHYIYVYLFLRYAIRKIGH